MLDVRAAIINDLQIPYNPNPSAPEADLDGSILVTGTGGFAGLFKNTGLFIGEFLIDYGLESAGRILLGTVGTAGLGGQIVVNHANVSETWDAAAEVSVDDVDLVDGYPQTPTELGGGTVGLVPFMLHHEACVPLSSETNNSMTFSQLVNEGIYLQFYGPIDFVGSPLYTQIERKNAQGQWVVQNPCSDGTDPVTLVAYSLEQSGPNTSPNAVLLKGVPPCGTCQCNVPQVQYRIVRKPGKIVCDLGLPTDPDVADFEYYFQIQ